MPERVLLGAVVAAHGIKGEVKVKTFTASPDALTSYGPLATDDGRVLRIASFKATTGDEAIVRFEGIADRNAAERLKGEQLSVPRDAFPEPEADEFYHADLIGLRVEDISGKELGKLAAVHNFGAGDIIEVVGANGATELVPFNELIVREIDMAKGRIVIDPPRYEEKS